MQSVTLFVLLCVAGAVLCRPEGAETELGAAHAPVPRYDAQYDAQPDQGSRAKRSLLMLKKKLLLGALGLKVAKVGAVGAGVAGALALKKKASHPSVPVKVVVDEGYHGYSSHAPNYNVEVHSWSG